MGDTSRVTSAYNRFPEPVAVTVTVDGRERAGFAIGWLGDRVDAKRLILGAYDGMTQAAATGVPFVSLLIPPHGRGPRHLAQET